MDEVLRNSRVVDPVTGRVQQSQRRTHRPVSFEELAASSFEASEVYRDLGIRLSPYSDLAKLIQGTVRLAEDWRTDPWAEIPEERVARSNYSGSICSAIVDAREDPELPKLLPRIARGSLNPLSRETSEARDVAWELQLRHLLRDHGLEAVLGEPDIIVRLRTGRFSIACKKLYREGHVAKRVSSGLTQLDGKPGIVAINIDDLLVDRLLFVAASPDHLLDTLNAAVSSFLRRHEDGMRRYLAAGRASAFLISLHAYGRCPTGIQEGRQVVLWAHPAMPPEHLPLLEEFRDALGPEG